MRFIQTYAKIDGDDDSDDQMSNAGGDEVNYSDLVFADDDEQNVQGQNPLDYHLMNVTRDLQKVIHNYSMSAELSQCSDPESIVPDCVNKVGYEYEKLKGFQKRTEKFAKDLQTFEENSKDSLYNAILFGAYHALLDNKKNFDFDQSRLVEVFGETFIDELQGKNEMFQLDLNPSSFQIQCHVINDILKDKILFLWVYELRKKFHCLIKKVPPKKNVVQRDLLTCVEKRFNDFNIVRRIAENEQKENYVAVDVDYKSVSRIDQIENFYFISSMRNAYRAASHLGKGLEITAAQQCHSFNKFFWAGKKSRESLVNVQLYTRHYLQVLKSKHLDLFW